MDLSSFPQAKLEDMGISIYDYAGNWMDQDFKLRELISEKVDLPKNRTIVNSFYSIYPIDTLPEADKIYDECDIFDPKVILKHAFFYEKYDPKKSYRAKFTKSINEVRDRLSILEAASLTEKEFVNYFYVAVEKFLPSKYRIFIVADEIIRAREIKLLGRYCQCNMCSLPWYSLLRYFNYYSYTGCLAGEIHDTYSIIGYSEVVDKTRQYINKSIKT